MTDFHLTRMGHTYYQHTLPGLVRQLDRLNGNLERLIQQHQSQEKSHGENRQESEDRDQEAQPPHA